MCGGAPMQTFRQVPALMVEVEAPPSGRGIKAGDEEAGSPAALPYRICAAQGQRTL